MNENAEQTEKVFERGWCEDCHKVQALGRTADGEYRCLGFGCGKPWFPAANPVPAEYEWLCPGCGKENRIPGLKDSVVCAQCGEEWQVNFEYVEHVYD